MRVRTWIARDLLVNHSNYAYTTCKNEERFAMPLVCAAAAYSLLLLLFLLLLFVVLFPTIYENIKKSKKKRKIEYEKECTEMSIRYTRTLFLLQILSVEP